MAAPTVAVLTEAFVCAATSAAVSRVLNLSATYVGSGDRANQGQLPYRRVRAPHRAVTADDVTQSTDQIKSIDVSDIPGRAPSWAWFFASPSAARTAAGCRQRVRLRCQLNELHVLERLLQLHRPADGAGESATRCRSCHRRARQRRGRRVVSAYRRPGGRGALVVQAAVLVGARRARSRRPGRFGAPLAAATASGAAGACRRRSSRCRRRWRSQRGPVLRLARCLFSATSFTTPLWARTSIPVGQSPPGSTPTALVPR